MKQLRLKETPRAGGWNYTVFEAEKPIAAWHSNRQVTSDVYVTIDSNGCFITHRTMPPKEIYGVAKGEPTKMANSKGVICEQWKQV